MLIKTLNCRKCRFRRLEPIQLGSKQFFFIVHCSVYFNKHNGLLYTFTTLPICSLDDIRKRGQTSYIVYVL